MANRIVLVLLSILSSGMSHSFDFPSNLYSKDIQWPSCEELRNLWFTLKQITYDGEITNEIPLIPIDSLRNMLISPHSSHYRSFPIGGKHRINSDFQTAWSKNRNHVRPTKVDEISDFFPQKGVAVPKQKPKNPSLQAKPLNNIALENEGYFGGFENGFQSLGVFPVPGEQTREQESMLLPITIKGGNAFGSFDKDSEKTQDFDGIYGLEEDVGDFGNFYDEGEPQSQRKPEIRTVKTSNRKWHNQPTSVGSRSEEPSTRLVLDTCDMLKEKSCSTNDHCACVGWETLNCIGGKCSMIHNTMTGRLEEMGAWYDGPLPFSQLGILNQRRRREKKSTLM